MDDEKKISSAKAKANRKNAKKSTGPRTQRGKQHSRCNALKHGLYSKEMLLSEADAEEFAAIRQQLLSQYEPETPMQWVGFDGINWCALRCKVAARLEARQFARQLEVKNQSGTEGEDGGSDLPLSRWYGTSRGELRAGIRALGHVRAEFGELGYLRDETKTWLSRGFGPDFVGTLSQWTTTSREVVLMANSIVAHEKNFLGDLYPRRDGPPNVVLDPQQSFEMVAKLIDERQHFLEEMLKLKEQDWSDGEGSESKWRHDFNPGFLTAANRELRRAVDWYLHLVESGL